MKRIILTLIIAFVFFESRSQSSWYTTTGGETILSLNAFNDPTVESTVLRFAPVFNSQTLLNIDLSNSFGIFTGLALRNVGFIADDPSDATVRKKFRTYNVAIPFGLKIGNLDGTFIYGGFDAEYAFNFKEKIFVDGKKQEKYLYWFSDRVQQWQPALHVGFQFVKGTNIKFKYYLNSFFNSERTDVYSSEYQRFDGNVFYFSLNSNLFYNSKFYYSTE
jgi:hypothetical protein